MKVESLEQQEHKCTRCHNQLYRAVSITENGFGTRHYTSDRLGCLHCGTEVSIDEQTRTENRIEESYRAFRMRVEETAQNWQKQSRYYVWERKDKKGEKKDDRSA